MVRRDPSTKRFDHIRSNRRLVFLKKLFQGVVNFLSFRSSDEISASLYEIIDSLIAAFTTKNEPHGGNHIASDELLHRSFHVRNESSSKNAL